MNEYYPGIPYSPDTTLAAGITDDAVTITVTDDLVFPDAPNLATIGYDDDNPETILYAEIDRINHQLKQVTRGFEGVAQAWDSGTEIARMFTAYDHDASNENTEELSDTFDYNDVADIADEFTLDVDNRRSKSFRFEVADTDAKEIIVSNVPTETTILIELVYTAAAAITYPTGITWLETSAPPLEAGYTYRILMITADGGTSWHATYVGGW